MEPQFSHEQLPSGKKVIREFGSDGFLEEEHNSYGLLDIGIVRNFQSGSKVNEMYYVNRRLVSRRSYEKARVRYEDMPPADSALEDWGGSLLGDVRKEQRQNKADAERRLRESDESRFPRPNSTNWLRVIAGDKAHLVLFASRDWKVLARERRIPTGREWLHQFGFDGLSSVARGLEVGFEVIGEREALLSASKRLLIEVVDYTNNPPDTTTWGGSVRPRPKKRKPPRLAWVTVLPPLIKFLSSLSDAQVKIFNHHR